MTTLTRNGTDGRVYGGDCNLIHIKDGERELMGANVAQFLDAEMRVQAVTNFMRTPAQADEQLLCPGCVMIALFNAALILADQNGQPRAELGRTMAAAFAALALNTAINLEEITIILD